MEERGYPLARLTSLGVGGPAERLLFPESEAELAAALRCASGEGVPVRALGGGRNLLVDDRGTRGLTIGLGRLKSYAREGAVLVAGAGVSTAALLSRAVGASLAGLECLVGVPGTVGGAVRMNAGGRYGFLGDRVLRVRGVDAHGEAFCWSAEECGFGYRSSRLAGSFVTEATFVLEPCDGDLRSRIRAIYEEKKASQPLRAATAGCMFRNPARGSTRSAGALLDAVGMKGVSRGGARYSPVHANFVENRGDARFSDVMELLIEGRRRVLDGHGVRLALEVEVWMREEEGAQLVA